MSNNFRRGSPAAMPPPPSFQSLRQPSTSTSSPFHLLHRPVTAHAGMPTLLFVNLHDHEEMLNSMLEQALASVLEAESGLSTALHELFMAASVNLGSLAELHAATTPSSPKTSSSFLNTLQDHWWSQLPPAQSCNSDCPICLCEYDPSDVVVNLPCHHTFHSTCALPWLEQHNVCPTCRYVLPSDESERTTKRSVDAMPIDDDDGGARRAAEPVSLTATVPGTMPPTTNDDPEEALLDAEAAALVRTASSTDDDNDMEDLVEEILDEMMEVEATSVVQQVQRHRQRMLEIDRILDEAIANDTVE
ncbi:Aste57867_12001 [Aphanomyces stellatus]|uniref:RING-type E3 ubiquitin transferase n=1 Tax=Aphanomyces stellatus TaxID=120398 RepID=A0A485KUG0_9STRA|nr:hypothetical protein As57867_011956 [Aphanomyces stellatus]VFT88856.1 Aste57867_12001 [Aphanomyces stellatus]